MNNKESRDFAINYFKSFLVIGMILEHSRYLLTRNSPDVITYFSTFVNLTTFAGFIFSYGYIFYKSYILKHDFLSAKYLNSSLKTLLAFYISGFLYRFLVQPGRWLTSKESIEILLLSDIPAYSEFLLSFFVLSILFYIFYKPVKKYVIMDNFILGGIIVSLLATFIPYEYIKINQIGILLGTYKFGSFPIIQYLCLFLIGIYFSKNNIQFNKKFFITSLITLIIFSGYMLVNHNLPRRFPPTIYWVAGSWFFIYVYYLFSQFLSRKHQNIVVLNIIGENTLSFLVVSNILIFTFRKIGFVNWYTSILIGFLIIAINYYLISITRKPKSYIK